MYVLKCINKNDLAFSKDLDKKAIQNLKKQLEIQKGIAFWANSAVQDSEFLKKFDYYQKGRQESIRKHNSSHENPVLKYFLLRELTVTGELEGEEKLIEQMKDWFKNQGRVIL